MHRDIVVGKRLPTGWTFRGSNTGDGQIFHTRRDRPWCPPSLLYSECLDSFPGLQQSGLGDNHPPYLALKLTL